MFCEACGYDFTTGTHAAAAGAARRAGGPLDADVTGGGAAPAAGDDRAAGAGARRAAFDWVAEVWIDPAWYEAQESPDPMPSPGLPEVVPLRDTSLLVGRTSRSRNIHPDIDCGTDSGVSRRQAQLTTDGTRWWVEDLDSANGTFVGSGQRRRCRRTRSRSAPSTSSTPTTGSTSAPGPGSSSAQATDDERSLG